MGAGVGSSQKTPDPPCHGVGKGLMTSYGPVTSSTINTETIASSPVPLLVKNKQYAISTVRSLARDADLEE